MNIEFMEDFFLYGFFINICILIWWAGFLVTVPDFVFGIHHKIIGVTREQFNGTHYIGLAFFKLANFIFFGVPYLAILLSK